MIKYGDIENAGVERDATELLWWKGCEKKDFNDDRKKDEILGACYLSAK